MDGTLLKGLTLLEWLVRQGRPCRLAEVAAAQGLPRSNAHRTLRTLLAAGWVRQDGEGGPYAPSLKMFELGLQVEAAADLRSRVRPHLARLAEQTRETIHLATLDGAELLYLDKFDSPLPVAAYSQVGGRAPAHCVASGKVLLAACGLDEAGLRDRLGSLQAHTPHSITRFDQLAEHLQEARMAGHAVNREEWRLGVCGLAVPLFDATGQPVAAVGMSVPALRFGRTQVRTLLEPLRACARDASAALGWHASTQAIALHDTNPATVRGGAAAPRRSA